MLNTTRQFVKLLFEEEEKESKGKEFTFETLKGIKNIIEWYLTK